MSEQSVILVVDDSEDDILLIQRGFQKANIVNPIQIARGGEEAMEYLGGAGRYSNRLEYPLPSLVLLDLKMPRRDGFEVLRWLRSQPGLMNVRVVVLTSSDAIRDVNLAYQLGASSFLVKPVDFEKFVEIANALSGYWLWMNKAPDTFRPMPQQQVSRKPPSHFLW